MTTTAADLSAVAVEPKPFTDAPRRWGLRRRILLIFTLGALLLSVVLASVTYGLARSSVVQQHDEASLGVARSHASDAASRLLSNPPTAEPTVRSLADDFGIESPLIFYNDRWIPGRPSFDETHLPRSFIDQVVREGLPSRMIVDVDGELYLAVGYRIQAAAAYVEYFSLEDVNSALRSVRLSLLLGTIITTALGVLAGSFAARRAVRPVGVAAQAAKAIAGGRLDTRLELTEDPDLSVLANSFNDMATALENRIERDARFASDVSHELRSPLMTLSASVEVMEARRDDMPERAQSALDLLKSDVVRFQGLVEDLLEISRFDAGAVRLNLEELLVAEFVRQAVRISSLPETDVDVSERSEMVLINGDRRRLARVVANLIDNARLHGDGEPEVAIRVVDADDQPVTKVRISVEDRGPGVPEAERTLIFERFARGGVAGRRAGNDGAGLGLSLVDEHVRMHGGRVWVEDRQDGVPGARFVIELDAEELDE